MRPGQEDVFAAEFDQAADAVLGRHRRFVADIGQPAGFVGVHAQHRGLRQKQFAQRGEHFIVIEAVVATIGQFRVEDHRHVGIVGQHGGDRRDVLGTARQADHEGVHGHVLEQRPRLLLDPAGIDGQNLGHAESIAHGHCGDHRQGMATDRRSAEQAGL